METAPKSSRRGSETRQKQHRITIRLVEADKVALDAAAQRAGQTVGSYIRERVLTAAVTKPRRRPSVDVAALTRLQGEMNKIGSNIHQLLRRVNFGETPAGDEVRSAFAGYREVVAAILAALGRAPR